MRIINTKRTCKRSLEYCDYSHNLNEIQRNVLNVHMLLNMQFKISNGSIGKHLDLYYITICM